MMKIARMLVIAAGCALVVGIPAGAGEEPAPVVLRHAVACPPFKGDPALAARYHDEMVRLLKSEPGIEYLEGARATGRRAPQFLFRVGGTIITNETGQPFVIVTLMDEARQERIASHVAPASAEPAVLAAWSRTLQAAMQRRAARLPFECRIRRHAGQQSVSLDRGLASGLQPGLVLYVSLDEEPLISPVTGEIVGRDSPRAVGQVQVFRVMENTVYARPVRDTKLPRSSRLYARQF